jgi:hypothetical protein
VTAISGAVVLETQQQFQQAGLQPAASDTVPTVPEPGVVALMIVAAILVFLPSIRRKLGRWRTRLDP